MTETEVTLASMIQVLNSELSSATLYHSPSLNDVDIFSEDRHLGVLADSKSLRNSISLIDTLPDELLVEIFYFCMESMTSEFGYRLKWLKIMYVCRKWYQLVMGSSSLWTNISIHLKDPKFTNKFPKLLELSKGCPLNLKIDVDEDEGRMQFLFQRLESCRMRIRSLVLTGFTEDARVFFREVNALPLCGLLMVNLRAVMVEESLLRIPDTYLSGSPKLHTISIMNTIINWKLLRRLTYLSIQFSFNLFKFSSLSEVLGILEHSPTLKTLQLYKVFPSDDHIFERVLPVVTLPQLQDLRCSGMVEMLHVLFLQLHIPTDTRLEFIAFDVPDGDYLHGFLVPLRRHLQRSSAPSFTWITLSYSNQAFTFHTGKEGYYRGPFVSNKLPQLTLVTHPTSQRKLRTIVTKILRAIPLSTNLNIDARQVMQQGEIDPKTWSIIFLHTLNLDSVKIGVNSGMIDMLTGFLKLLQDGSRYLSGEARRAATRRNWCPPGPSNLSHLTLVASIEHHTHWGSETDQGKWYNALADFLTEYRELEKSYKPYGQVFKSVDFVSVSHVYDRKYSDAERDRLFPLVGKLSIEGEIYDLVRINSR